MEIRTKKIVKRRIEKLLTGGKIQEVLIKEDILNLEDAKINICFKGNISSGIVSLTIQEARDLNKTLEQQLKFRTKIIK